MEKVGSRSVCGWLETLAKVCLGVGGLSALALAVATVSYLTGEREFPGVEGTVSFGSYFVLAGGMLLVAFVLWRICIRVVMVRGSDRDVTLVTGQEAEYEQAAAQERHMAYMAQPVTHRCTACPASGFRSYDEALDHGEQAHGHDRLPEEVRSLIRKV